MTLAQQQLQADYEKIKGEETEKSQKLQELMSVSLDNKLRSKLQNILKAPARDSPNMSLENSPKNSPSKKNSLMSVACPVWEDFVPYKNEVNSKISKDLKNSEKKVNLKADKNLQNYAAKSETAKSKCAKTLCTMSIFHIHTFHLHLIVSITLLLVTHKCPQYLVIY